MEKTDQVRLAWHYIKLNDVDNLKPLLSGGLNPNSSLIDSDCDINRLLSAAAAFGAFECLVSLFDEGGNIEIVSQNGYSLVHWAACGGWNDIILFLAAKGLSLDAEDANGQTPLHLAAAHGHLSTINLLISHGANINSVTKFKWTPLHVCIAYGQQYAAAALLQSGADSSLVDSFGRSPEVLANEYHRKWWNDLLNANDSI